MKSEFAFNQLTPFVRVAVDVVIQKAKKPQTVCTSDHRLFYVKSGSALIEIDGVDYRVWEGSSLYFMSGIPYRIQPEREDLGLIAVNFDFTDANKEKVNCIPLTPAEDYSEMHRFELLQIKDIPELNGIILVHGSQAYLPLFRQLVDVKEHPCNYQDKLAGSLLLSLLLSLCTPQRTLSENAAHDCPVKEILDYLQLHYTENITNEFLAKKFNYHPSYISQMICAHAGLPLHRYLLRIRVQKALYLLQTTDTPIREIALSVGFRDVSYFSQYFRKTTGHSPGKYRAGL